MLVVAMQDAGYQSYSLLQVKRSRTSSSHKALHPFHFSKANARDEESGEEEATNHGKQRALGEGACPPFPNLQPTTERIWPLDSRSSVLVM